MKTSEFLTVLEQNPNKKLQFEYHKGQFAREDFHITEIKNVTYDTVDCGGIRNEWSETIVQLWENQKPDGNYVDTSRALHIADSVEKVRPTFKDTEIKFEYGNSLFHTAILNVEHIEIGEEVTVKLFPESTTCKAQDRAGTDAEKAEACCAPQVKPRISIKELASVAEGETCAPGSGCC
ncbi:MAG: DUF6428 family protein [Flavobacteriales bacterium]